MKSHLFRIPRVKKMIPRLVIDSLFFEKFKNGNQINQPISLGLNLFPGQQVEWVTDKDAGYARVISCDASTCTLKNC